MNVFITHAVNLYIITSSLYNGVHITVSFIVFWPGPLGYHCTRYGTIRKLNNEPIEYLKLQMVIEETLGP